MAAKNKTTKTTALTVPTPRNQEAANELLAEVGRLQRELAQLELGMNSELAARKEVWAEDAAPLNAQLEETFRALYIWAEANREELLHDGGKTVKLSAGELSWRMTPPSVRVTGPEVVLETLRRLGLTRFIRVKDELDKVAVLAEPEAVAGVKGLSISQREEFVAKPFETQLEQATPVKRETR